MQGILGKNKIVIWQSGIERPKRNLGTRREPLGPICIYLCPLWKKVVWGDWINNILKTRVKRNHGENKDSIVRGKFDA